jgi:hypothetical protein
VSADQTTAEQTTTIRLTSLADELARAESGTGFVYVCLARLVEELDLDQAIAVVERGGVTQVFNRSGLPLTVGWERHIALSRTPGIHTVPERPAHSDVLAEAHHLCAVAGRLAQRHCDDLESMLRDLGGIVAVGHEAGQASTTVQVLVDASRAPARVREVVRKLARAATDGPLVLEVIVHEPARLRA